MRNANAASGVAFSKQDERRLSMNRTVGISVGGLILLLIVVAILF